MAYEKKAQKISTVVDEVDGMGMDWYYDYQLEHWEWEVGVAQMAYSRVTFHNEIKKKKNCATGYAFLLLFLFSNYVVGLFLNFQNKTQITNVC